MGMYYSSSKKKLFIDWDEKKKDAVEHWHGDFTPINVFYHPKQQDKLFRVKLKGKIPKWVERFAAANKYKTGVASHGGKEGFWIANWNGWDTGEKPISAPNLDGAIHQFIKMIPEGMKTTKDKLKDNVSIVKENFLKNPSFFEDMGIYYKFEEIEGIEGTLLIDNDVFLDKGELTDEQYAKLLEVDGRLEKIVWEITTPVPEPISLISEEAIDDEETFEEEEIFFENELVFDESEFTFDTDDQLELEEDDSLEINEDKLSLESEEIILIDDNPTLEEASLIDLGESEELEETTEISHITSSPSELLFEIQEIKPQTKRKRSGSKKKKEAMIGETIPLF